MRNMEMDSIALSSEEKSSSKGNGDHAIHLHVICSECTPFCLDRHSAKNSLCPRKSHQQAQDRRTLKSHPVTAFGVTCQKETTPYARLDDDTHWSHPLPPFFRISAPVTRRSSSCLQLFGFAYSRTGVAPRLARSHSASAFPPLGRE